LTLNGKVILVKDHDKYQSAIDDLRATAFGYEMPSEVAKPAVTPKGIPSSTCKYMETNFLTPEQKYVNWKIEEELKNDKILGENGKAFNLELTDKYLIINGKEQPKEMHNKYIDIYYSYSGEQRCAGCTFKISLNRQDTKSSGW
jgi:hypothetical protein